MDYSVVVRFLSKEKIVFGYHLLADFPEVQRLYSSFGFYVCFVGDGLAVMPAVVKINEVEYAAQHGLSEIRLVDAFV